MIPAVIAGVVLLRLLWVAAFRPTETVSGVPELDGYVPREPQTRRGIDRDRTPNDDRTRGDVDDGGVEPGIDDGEPDGSLTDVAEPVSASETADDGEPTGEGTDVVEADSDGEFPDDGGVWIELDVEPLFPSSGHPRIIDLTEENEPEATP